jgi:hypothetical protein
MGTKRIITILSLLAVTGIAIAKNNSEFKTVCNPVNLNYRFCLDEPSRREAADPTIINYKNRIFLFASKSGGYWYSDDMISWNYVIPEGLPLEDYAPTVVVIDDVFYFLASSNEKSTVFKSTDPVKGKWEVAVEALERPVWDPALFLDKDKRLYLYWGCSDRNPLYGVEVDYNNNFKFFGKPKELMKSNTAEHGWEVPGDFNRKTKNSPWIEGAWVNEYNGKYYLQYAGPGTEYKSYSDGVYVSENPLGPFKLQDHNPFSYKPDGFTSGAGHGSTFCDKFGNFWHVGTVTISTKHMFERRLSICPAFFDNNGNLYSTTKFGDYPYIIPQKKIKSFEDIFPGWMLLSYNKKTLVSSSVDTLPAAYIADEDIRTYWAAKTGGPDEFAMLDLGEKYDVYSLQINFAEHNTNIYGRKENTSHKYLIESSEDGKNWNVLIDKSANNTDNTHEYFQLPEKKSCRYLRIKNIQVPDGNFAISGFRVFGKGHGNLPGLINNFEAKRDASDRRVVRLSWNKSPNATGYNIKYGTENNMLYHNYVVYGDSSLTINSLNTNLKYYFSIEAFNENGIKEMNKIVCAE